MDFTQRFELLLGPDNRWMLWDREFGAPVEFAGRPLMGLNEIEARAAAIVIPRVYARRAEESRGDAA